MVTRRSVLGFVPALAFGMTASVTLAQAQEDWPQGQIQIVSTTAPGGGADNMLRAFADFFQKQTGQAAVIENKPGTAGAVAVQAIKDKPADGSTFLQLSVSISSGNPAVFKELSYDAGKDFTPVGMLGVFPYIVVVRPDSPFQTMDDLLKAAKAEPGNITYGFSSAASQIPPELIKIQANIDMLGVRYKAAPQVVTDVAGGQVEFAVLDGISVISSIKGGLLRPLAVTSVERFAELPDVQALAEILPGFNYEGWVGMGARTGVPQPILERMNALMVEAIKNPDTIKALKATGAAPRSMSLEEINKFVVEDRKNWVEMVRVAKIPQVD